MKKILTFIIITLFLSACEKKTTTQLNTRQSNDKGIYVTPVSTTTNYKKVALVIGNRLYEYGTLTNTVNDATDVADTLRQIGFDVIFKTDLNQRKMDYALKSFKKRLSKSKSVGFFYFSGHGTRVNGNNYLLPIDNNKIQDEDDLQYYAIDSRKILTIMQKARNNINIIVLDACRDNPYNTAGKTIKRGLTEINPRKGSIIAFATDVGKTASDVSKNGRNGLFTSHLIKALKNADKTHQRVDDMFMAVSDAVTQESKGRQEPWQLDSLKRPFCFGGCRNQVATVITPPMPVIVPPQPIIVTPPPQVKPLSVGTIFRDRLLNGDQGPEMVVIPAGSFRIGDIQDGGNSDEKPVHQISVKRFAMGRYEVTFADYDKFVETTGRKKPSDQGWGRDKHPVINVSWNDATAYAQWLSQQTGNQYRLPTEAEWEYAARAGTQMKYWWGNSIHNNRANCDGCGSQWDDKSTSPVGSFQPNPFGLYDTVGNVWEWTCSEYTKKYNGKENLTASKNYSKYKVLRGGSWNSNSENVRSANRYRFTSVLRVADFGFRLVREYNFTSEFQFKY